MKSYLKKTAVVLFCIFCFVGCDQSAKHIAKDQLIASSIVSYAGGLVRFVYVENSGAMLSFGAELSKAVRFYVLIVGVSIVLTLFICYIIIKKRENLIKDIALILVVSGGLGNLTDRIFNNGKVIDFIIIGVSGIQTAVFNLADVFITFGTILFIFSRAKKTDGEVLDSGV